MKVCEKPNTYAKDEKVFFKIVKAAFAQRRKTLLNCLANGLGRDKAEISQILESVGVDPTIRGERLGIDEFAAICNAMCDM